MAVAAIRAVHMVFFVILISERWSGRFLSRHVLHLGVGLEKLLSGVGMRSQRFVAVVLSALVLMVATGFVAPLKPFNDAAEDRRCAAIGSFVEAFASQRLSKSKVNVLQCEELVDPPESPWLAATLSYTYKNMTRILQLCVRATRTETNVTLSSTGGPCVDEYFAAFEKIASESAAGRPVDKLPRAIDVEADPGLMHLKPELMLWLGVP